MDDVTRRRKDLSFGVGSAGTAALGEIQIGGNGKARLPGFAKRGPNQIRRGTPSPSDSLADAKRMWETSVLSATN